ncbi:putative inactive dual specificity protein phosphatase-like At4g18593 [Silene latifolia]|uniref:putative inactive dual specificity protein phosphatase-like At4g18593 n=1 Tax=Silene latifolia TaxID=37657 RepID=UPI003D7844C4
MTEAISSDQSLGQQVQECESSCSDMCPESPDLKVPMQETENVVVLDQNARMSESGNNPEVQVPETNSTSDIIPDMKGKLIYRCKKCRQIVASDETLVSHEQGNGEASFRGRKKSVNPNTPECTAIFVEPLKWMAPVQDGYLSEKLYCIGCKGKLGFFSWVGIQCSCGAWVRPGFQIQKCRVDECRI